MPYDVNAPAVRYDTNISREHYGKYRVLDNGKSIFSRYSLWKGNDTDLVEKTQFGLVYGTFPALIAAFHANAKHRGQFTILSVAEKSFKHGTPWLISGATYGITVGLLTHLRKKEDAVNHMAGGYAAGTMLGAWYKWPKFGFWSGVVMGIAAGLMKEWYLECGETTLLIRRQRIFNMYRRGWFIDRPDAEGQQDAEIDVSFKEYRA